MDPILTYSLFVGRKRKKVGHEKKKKQLPSFLGGNTFFFKKGPKNRILVAHFYFWTPKKNKLSCPNDKTANVDKLRQILGRRIFLPFPKIWTRTSMHKTSAAFQKSVRKLFQQ